MPGQRGSLRVATQDRLACRIRGCQQSVSSSRSRMHLTLGASLAPRLARWMGVDVHVALRMACPAGDPVLVRLLLHQEEEQ